MPQLRFSPFLNSVVFVCTVEYWFKVRFGMIFIGNLSKYFVNSNSPLGEFNSPCCSKDNQLGEVMGSSRFCVCVKVK